MQQQQTKTLTFSTSFPVIKRNPFFSNRSQRNRIILGNKADDADDDGFGQTTFSRVL